MSHIVAIYLWHVNCGQSAAHGPHVAHQASECNPQDILLTNAHMLIETTQPLPKLLH